MEYDLSLRDYWRVLRKRKLIIFFAAFMMGLLVFVMASLKKPIPLYESFATVKIEKNSTATGLYLEALSWSGADYLETQAAIITSYPIMELVAKELDIIDKGMDTLEIRTDRDLIGKVLALKGKVTAEREGESNLLNITVRDTDPKSAQTIANMVARIFTLEHTKKLNKRTFDSRNFIEKQLKEVSGKLQEAEGEVRAYREKHRLISLDSQTNRLLSKVAEAEAEQLKVSKVVEELYYIIDRLGPEKVKAITTKDNFFITTASPLYNSLNNKLVAQLIEKDALLLTFTDEHPKIVAINSQLTELATNMRAQLHDKLNNFETTLDETTLRIESLQQKISTLPDKALTLARLERGVKFNEGIFELLESKLQETKIMEAAKIEEVYIVKPALESQVAINRSQVKMKAVVGVVIGLILGAVFAFIYETFDTSIGAIHEVEEFTGTSVLGVIPAVDMKEIKINAIENLGHKKPSEDYLNLCSRLIIHFMPNSVAAENYRTIKTNIHFAKLDKEVKSIAFTSSLPDEGKTTTLVNTAIAMAQSLKKVLLIEADLRKPVLSEWFGISKSPGLSDVLIGSYEWRDAVKGIVDFMLGEMDVDDVMQTPGLDYLNVMTAGNLAANPGELIASERFMNFFEEVKKEYDIICIDVPPTLAVADASHICSKVDGVLMVYKVGGTPRDSLKRSLDQLKHVRANVIGIVLNGIKSEISPDYDQLAYQQYNHRSS